MTAILRAYAAGLYPRSEPLVKETWAFDKGTLPHERLVASFRREQVALGRRQSELGFAWVSDGQLRWQDKFRPIVEATDGLEVGALTRHYETNTFFKRPVVVGDLRLDVDRFAPFVEPAAWSAAPSADGRTSRGGPPSGGAAPAARGVVQLPAPHYFAQVAEDATGGDPEDRALAFARVLNEAARHLATRGVGLVEFADPHLLYARTPDDSLAEAVKVATRGVEARTSYFAFNGPVGSRAAELAELPVDLIGFDATRSTPEEAAPLAGRALALGLVAGDNSLLEDPARVARQAQAFAKALRPKELLVRPQWDLEFVPEPIAARKLEVLAAVAAREVAA